MKTATNTPLEAPFPLFTSMNRSMEKLWGIWRQGGDNAELNPNEAAKEFDRTFQQGLRMAHTMVQDSLLLQKRWVEGCCKLTSDMKTAPPELQRTAEQLNETLSTMIDVRASLWEQWFDGVRGLENGTMPALMKVLSGMEQAIGDGAMPSADGSTKPESDTSSPTVRRGDGQSRKAG
ncbi:hypothetical protein M0534_01670 [Methylonatrum kenyense]|uniref:hypothetical protein n=1 Tax=Methylonatrum kenyense TaxID=455253 RepID=UPI0020C01406|nr:hypothetical protein [Methylonatrum kenyense]MCK8515040.1 hypothetical protein [Methylonatrum kenyense]